MNDSAKRQITYKKTIEVVDGAHPMPLRRVVRIILLALLISLMLGSHAFQVWANNLPIGPVSDFLLYVAQYWQELMSKIGVARLAEGLRGLLHAFEGSP